MAEEPPLRPKSILASGQILRTLPHSTNRCIFKINERDDLNDVGDSEDGGLIVLYVFDVSRVPQSLLPHPTRIPFMTINWSRFYLFKKSTGNVIGDREFVLPPINHGCVALGSSHPASD